MTKKKNTPTKVQRMKIQDQYTPENVEKWLKTDINSCMQMLFIIKDNPDVMTSMVNAIMADIKLDQLVDDGPADELKPVE